MQRPAADNLPPPPLPMFSAAGDPDAWHNVTAPGGYEWWYFDAESADQRTHLVGIFLEGFVFHPGYLRRYAAYRRRPTRRPPPTAGDFPCAYFVLYQDGRVAHQFMTQYSPEEFAASTDRPEVHIGPNRMTRDRKGNYRVKLAGTPWKLTARGPQTLEGQTLSADLTFSPSFHHPPMQRRFLSREMTGADHHWVLAAPHCRVEGRVDPGDGSAFELTGRGYHDHNYGTAPLGIGLKRWVWGRVLTDDRVIGFHVAEPRNSSLKPEIHSFEVSDDGVTDHHETISDAETACRVDWSGRSSMLLAYPKEIDLGKHLRLTNGRVVDSAPFYLRASYTAEGSQGGSTAFCEVAHPHRLRWPILGRMIEMSIDRPRSSGPGDSESRD